VRAAKQLDMGPSEPLKTGLQGAARRGIRRSRPEFRLEPPAFGCQFPEMTGNKRLMPEPRSLQIIFHRQQAWNESRSRGQILISGDHGLSVGKASAACANLKKPFGLFFRQCDKSG